jgi:hypothetical protein
MGSAFGLWNSQPHDVWFVLRSSKGVCVLACVPAEKHTMISLSDGEIVTSFMHESREKAEASIGKGERDKFKEWPLASGKE